MGPPTTLARFAECYRLRVRRDECGDTIVRGKLGHLYEHDAGRFGIVLEAPSDDARSDKTLRARRRRAIAAGFLVHQEGEFEALLLFDPGDGKQALLAVLLIQAKKIRQAAQASDAQLRARALFSSKARSRRACIDQNTNAIVGQGRCEPRSLGVGFLGIRREQSLRPGMAAMASFLEQRMRDDSVNRRCSGTVNLTVKVSTNRRL